MKLQNEYYKPRDLSENNELENLIDAILNQRSMAMDSGYVADVSGQLITKTSIVLDQRKI